MQSMQIDPSPDGFGDASPSVTTRFEGTRWHIPGGWDYVSAQVVTNYFDTEEGAQAFERHYHDMPYMGEYHVFNPKKLIDNDQF